MKINKRDVVFFTLGIIFMLVVSVLYDWESFKNGITGEPEARIESTQ